jgi:hypothetical protein
MQRSFEISSRASWMLAHTPVPTSIIDWIISGFTFSPNKSFPSSSISETWDFNSRVSGSTI